MDLASFATKTASPTSVTSRTACIMASESAPSPTAARSGVTVRGWNLTMIGRSLLFNWDTNDVDTKVIHLELFLYVAFMVFINEIEQWPDSLPAARGGVAKQPAARPMSIHTA